jgi:hypothetical protein
VESLFDLELPVEVAELPADLAVLDELLTAPGLLAPIEASWAADAVGFGRPTVPMDRFVRLMIVKARSGWGYETLVREVSDCCICGASAGSVCGTGCRMSPRSASSCAAWART